MTETIPYLPGLSPVSGKELPVRFDGGRLSSDGGVLLLREIENGLGLAARLSSCLKDKLRRFFQVGYQAKSWSRKRKVIARVEATSKGSDIRFVVTNLPGRAKVLYEKVYCARGNAENMIKDQKTYTKSDRTSCHRWQANQFRLFLHTGAYWLLHRLGQASPRKSPWRKATFETLRRVFLKVAARIEELKSRIRIALPSAYPYRSACVATADRITALGA